MKKLLFIFLPVVLATIAILQNRNNGSARQMALVRIANAAGCSPIAGNTILPGENGKFIGLLPGWGNHFYKITTSSDSAQIYFNQGLTMYYSYHSREAVASFKEAARFDSTCTMAYWGEALAKGPPYNYGHLYKMDKNIFDIISSMNRFAANAGDKEKDLVAAMNMRYSAADPEDNNRMDHNIGYVSALKKLVSLYSGDNDIKALYIDAMMLVHSWDFWYNNGNPKEWTTELVNQAKQILTDDSHHPAALHYFIHLTEASGKNDIALPHADSLKKLFPSVAHMVHMASHEYERNGHYLQGIDVNNKADSNIVQYSRLTNGLIQSVHVPHYDAVAAYCALSAGMYQTAIEKAIECREHVTPDALNTYQQYLYMFPGFVMVRNGKWMEILNDSAYIPGDWTYAGIIRDFAKGMAYARTKEIAKAVKCLEALKQKKQDEILKTRFTPYMSSPFECTVIAENILYATILTEQKKYQSAIAAFTLAVKAEDELLYTEPKIWMIPARQYLGALLLQLQRPAEAEKVYSQDLASNPGNGWSTLGLYQSLQQQHKTKELSFLEEVYSRSFSHAEKIPLSSAY